jgi:hypothetical protein
MNIRVLAATVAGGIVMTLVGWLLFGIIFMSYFQENTHHYAGLEKNPPDWIPLILFNLVFAWLIAFVFDFWATIKTFVGGIKGGVLIMLPIGIAFCLQHVAFLNIYKNYFAMILDVLLTAVIGAIAGGVIGLVLGVMHKKTDNG